MYGREAIVLDSCFKYFGRELSTREAAMISPVPDSCFVFLADPCAWCCSIRKGMRLGNPCWLFLVNTIS